MSTVILIAYHFLCTFLALAVLRFLDVFKAKSVSLLSILPLSLTFCGSMVLSNMSLKANTVGTYQALKCLADPLFVVIQYTFYNKKYTLPVILTLIPMMAGIVMNSWFDIEFSPLGTTYALAAVVVTAVYTVWIGRGIKKITCNRFDHLGVKIDISPKEQNRRNSN